MKFVVIENNPMSIQFFKRPRLELYEYPIRLCPYSIPYIKDANESLWIKAINVKPYVIKFLNYYSERVWFSALKAIVQVLITYQETVKADAVRQYVLSL